MADLESCYFCGSVEDLGEYATPPARLLPDGHDAQSAILCPDCRGKLRDVLEPIAAHVEELETTPEPAAADQQLSTGSTDDASADDSPSGADDGTVETSDDERPGVDELAAEAAAGAAPDTPDGYRRVLRLLRNRELPMARADVVALTSGAYELGEAQCEEILDAAIERGDLGESGDQITR